MADRRASRLPPGPRPAKRQAAQLLGWSGPLGRRILLSFLAAAAVPMLLMLAVMLPALESLDRTQDHETQARLLRQVAQQVFDRIGVARQMVVAWPPDGPGRHGATAGLGDVFRRVAWLDPEIGMKWLGAAQEPPVEEQQLVSAWQSRPAGADALLVTPKTVPGRSEGPVWLILGTGRGQAWLAELRADFLWRPIVDTGGDSHWCVRDHGGQSLTCDAVRLAVPLDPDTELQGRWDLFLAGEFASQPWQFEMRQARGGAMLAGMPVQRWLISVSAAALLVATLLSLTQIRRTLVPLRHLHRAVRRMARREPGARVEVCGRDELAELGGAFNAMAERIDAQFHSLEMLGAIDRDILSAEPVERVIERVLSELLANLPCVSVALVRRESAHSNAVIQSVRRRGGTTSPGRRLQLTDADWKVFARWPGDQRVGHAAAQRQAWSMPAEPGAVDEYVYLPVRNGGELEAIVMLGIAPAVRLGAEMRRTARDLRDRIGVALSAHRREAELAYRAAHDTLTGLLNRTGAHERLDAWLACGQPAVLCIDLDRFKQVNDSLGHEVGDELLRQAAERLQGCAPPDGIVARLGGDEFLVVLPDVAAQSAAITSALAQEICTRLALPFRLRGQDLVLGASVGIALAAAHGRSRADLMRHGDIAMYEAKRAGRGRFAMFEMPLDALVLERTQLLSEMREALQRHEFVLHYQPRVRSVDGRIASAEALVRWQHPKRGLLPPGKFIDLAEESDLIEAIGNEVIEQACKQMGTWCKAGLPLERVSVNVSPRQLQSDQLLAVVRAALARHRLPATALELEVTESLLVGDAREAHAQLAELRRWGVLIALDDFGTGYSSMATLHQLPIDVMKVDRAFVKNLGVDDSSMAITRAIVALGQSLGLHTVAEGMETEAQAALVNGLGIDEMQGFFFSKPLDPAAFAALVLQGDLRVPAPVVFNQTATAGALGRRKAARRAAAAVVFSATTASASPPVLVPETRPAPFAA